jgi:hypothetical protein
MGKRFLAEGLLGAGVHGSVAFLALPWVPLIQHVQFNLQWRRSKLLFCAHVASLLFRTGFGFRCLKTVGGATLFFFFVVVAFFFS